MLSLKDFTGFDLHVRFVVVFSTGIRTCIASSAGVSDRVPNFFCGCASGARKTVDNDGVWSLKGSWSISSHSFWIHDQVGLGWGDCNQGCLSVAIWPQSFWIPRFGLVRVTRAWRRGYGDSILDMVWLGLGTGCVILLTALLWLDHAAQTLSIVAMILRLST